MATIGIEDQLRKSIQAQVQSAVDQVQASLQEETAKTIAQLYSETLDEIYKQVADSVAEALKQLKTDIRGELERDLETHIAKMTEAMKAIKIDVQMSPTRRTIIRDSYGRIAGMEDISLTPEDREQFGLADPELEGESTNGI